MNETRKWAAELLAPHYGNDSAALIAGVVALAACVEGEAATVRVGSREGMQWSKDAVELARSLAADGKKPAFIAATLSAETGRPFSAKAVIQARHRYGIPCNATAGQLRAMEAARAAARRNGAASA